MVLSRCIQLIRVLGWRVYCFQEMMVAPTVRWLRKRLPPRPDPSVLPSFEGRTIHGPDYGLVDVEQMNSVLCDRILEQQRERLEQLLSEADVVDMGEGDQDEGTGEADGEGTAD